MKDKRWTQLMQAWLDTPVNRPLPENMENPRPRGAATDFDALISAPSSVDRLDVELSDIDRYRTITPALLAARFPDYPVTAPAATHVTVWMRTTRGIRQPLASFTVQAVLESPGGVHFMVPDIHATLYVQLHHGQRISTEVAL